MSEAAALLELPGTDSVVSMSADHSFYWGEAPGDLVEPLYDLAARPRRQDLPPRWRENGAIYGVARDVWDRTGVRAGGRIAAYVMPAHRSLEIDTEADWRLAEAMLATGVANSAAGDLMAGVKVVAFDFDGVMTDNTVMVSQDGTESVLCSRSDGWGIAALMRFGMPMVVISTEENPVVAARCTKLSIDCVQGVTEKSSALASWLSERGLTFADCAFLGNDENDRDCLEAAGVAVVTADAHESVRGLADLVLENAGGHGAVRELCDIIMTRDRFATTRS
jgi:N-acylneuraminate cytidylyltransferase